MRIKKEEEEEEDQIKIYDLANHFWLTNSILACAPYACFDKKKRISQSHSNASLNVWLIGKKKICNDNS